MNEEVNIDTEIAELKEDSIATNSINQIPDSIISPGESEKNSQSAEELELKNQQQQKLIEELKKQLTEKQKTNNSSLETNRQSNNNYKESYTAPEEVVNYTVIIPKINISDNIPEPEHASRPYYLDGDKLNILESPNSTLINKIMGLERRTDELINASKLESTLKFRKNNIPRFFIKLDEEDTNPSDVVRLCQADIRIGKRLFLYSSHLNTGEVKDISNKFIPIEFKKITSGLYEIIIDIKLQVGEYGFLPIKSEGGDSITNNVKINCFGVIE